MLLKSGALIHGKCSALIVISLFDDSHTLGNTIMLSKYYLLLLWLRFRVANLHVLQLTVIGCSGFKVQLNGDLPISNHLTRSWFINDINRWERFYGHVLIELRTWYSRLVFPLNFLLSQIISHGSGGLNSRTVTLCTTGLRRTGTTLTMD